MVNHLNTDVIATSNHALAEIVHNQRDQIKGLTSSIMQQASVQCRLQRDLARAEQAERDLQSENERLRAENAALRSGKGGHRNQGGEHHGRGGGVPRLMRRGITAA